MRRIKGRSVNLMYAPFDAWIDDVRILPYPSRGSKDSLRGDSLYLTAESQRTQRRYRIIERISVPLASLGRKSADRLLYSTRG
jgi:hypothetical protein